MLTIRVVHARDTHAELTSLGNWLAREDEFRGRVRIEQPLVASDRMGSLYDVLVVTLGTGGAVTVLAKSISVWLMQRRSDVEIEVNGQGGRSVTVSVKRASDAAALITQVLSATEDHDKRDS